MFSNFQRGTVANYGGSAGATGVAIKINDDGMSGCVVVSYVLVHVFIVCVCVNEPRAQLWQQARSTVPLTHVLSNSASSRRRRFDTLYYMYYIRTYIYYRGMTMQLIVHLLCGNSEPLDKPAGAPFLLKWPIQYIALVEEDMARMAEL